MKTQKKFKPIPKFISEEEEVIFWDTHDSTEYLDWSKAKPLVPFLLSQVKKEQTNKKKQKLKPIPNFKNEDEEFEFWSTHDTTDYFDYSTARHVDFPNLKMTPQDKINKIKPSKEEYPFIIHDAPRKESSQKKS